jgi:hypothetical protein
MELDDKKIEQLIEGEIRNEVARRMNVFQGNTHCSDGYDIRMKQIVREEIRAIIRENFMDKINKAIQNIPKQEFLKLVYEEMCDEGLIHSTTESEQ